MANFTKLTDAEKEVISTFTFNPKQAQEWRDTNTWDILQDQVEASKWCANAVHVERLNFEAAESLHRKKMIYWYASEDGNPYYHLTPKGFKAAAKAGILHNNI